jgi:hypothetical protein
VTADALHAQRSHAGYRLGAARTTC